MSQRTACAFDNAHKARNHARALGAACVVEDVKGNFWAIPLERYARGGLELPGPWRNGAEVDTDPTGAYGTARPVIGVRP